MQCRRVFAWLTSMNATKADDASGDTATAMLTRLHAIKNALDGMVQQSQDGSESMEGGHTSISEAEQTGDAGPNLNQEELIHLLMSLRSLRADAEAQRQQLTSEGYNGHEVSSPEESVYESSESEKEENSRPAPEGPQPKHEEETMQGLQDLQRLRVFLCSSRESIYF